ncbi:MAG: transcription-repair coupling factor [Candidatus Pacebacteria bacterium]|nr:transcription-repair coupling factor [Candidatus Paceibacterota bacterium]
MAQKTMDWTVKLKQWARKTFAERHEPCVHLHGPELLPAGAATIMLAHAGRVLLVTPEPATADHLAEALRNYQAIVADPRPLHSIPEVKGFRREWVPENEAARAAALDAALSSEPAVFVTSAAAIVTPTTSPTVFGMHRFELRKGTEDRSLESIIGCLIDLDYDNELEVHMPGEFAHRGGILDIYSPLYEYPVRLEFFGNRIDTMRFFDPETQRSFRAVHAMRIIPRGEAIQETDNKANSDTLLSYFTHDTTLVVCGMRDVSDHIARYGEDSEEHAWQNAITNWQQRLVQLHGGVHYAGAPSPSDDTKRCVDLPCRRAGENLASFLAEFGPDAVTLHWQLLRDNLRRWAEQTYTIVACCGNEGEATRFKEMLRNDGLTRSLPVQVTPHVLDAGVLFSDIGLVLLSEHEIFGKRLETRRRRRSKYRADYGVHDEMSLEQGCYAVHASHGVCLFHGIREIEVSGAVQEAVELEFADDARLFVPLDQAHLVSRYVGGSKKLPKLSKVGGNAWNNQKKAAASAAFDVAAELLRLEAVRRQSKGTAFQQEHEWEHAFAQAFPYVETADQQQAIADVLQDMAKTEPMDRLLCGDVGYGKTEIAMRAAFRAVMNGKQVAVLVPTTVLAQQHYLTFRDRMAEYPVEIDMLSRFKTTAEQRSILDALATGELDIVIGTHRLIQDDIHFNDLGLLVVDEEQRFGVKHKERLKRLRASLDILTMTATPIPRTLYFSLSGIRNLSTIMTPPAERLPIRTVVAQYDNDLIREAILRELERKGQVFFLHNRVQTIDNVHRHLTRLVPEATFGVAHGQMPAHELENIMIQYLNGDIDVLVCTTIIESGLDITNANTILIDRADRFGLAELYQLRGRVGRYHNQAYAYLLLPPMGALPRNARERLAAIRQYTHLGAGFKLALRDLEIRGAGNILGTEQSGHVAAVGFELYCELLREAVAQLENKPAPRRPPVDVNLPGVSLGLQARKGRQPAALPPGYIAAEGIRLDSYRRLSKMQTVQEVDTFQEELEDRFGPPPIPAITLLEITRLRITAAAAGISAISIRNNKLLLQTDQGFVKTAHGKLPAEPSPNDPPLARIRHLRDIVEHVKKYGTT